MHICQPTFESTFPSNVKVRMALHACARTPWRMRNLRCFDFDDVVLAMWIFQLIRRTVGFSTLSHWWERLPKDCSPLRFLAKILEAIANEAAFSLFGAASTTIFCYSWRLLSSLLMNDWFSYFQGVLDSPRSIFPWNDDDVVEKQCRVFTHLARCGRWARAVLSVG